MKNSYAIRTAAEDDLRGINDIYNYYVHHSTCTYQEEAEPLESRRQWFARHGGPHPVTVAEHDGMVVGWGALSAYHPRSAYRRTVENSVYVHPEHHRQGIGRLLLQDLILRARSLDHHAIMAVIDGEQAASIKLHEGFEFVKVGHFKEIGFKFGGWLDVVYMELILR